MFAYIGITGFFQYATKTNELLDTMTIAFDKNITIVIEPLIQYLEDTILNMCNEGNENDDGSSFAEPFFSSVPRTYEELHRMVIDGFGFIERKHIATPANFGKVGKKLTAEHRLFGSNECAEEIALDPTGLLDRFMLTLTQKAITLPLFVFTCSILAAIKLLIKIDRVKCPDSKLSKDEQIIFQTIMQETLDAITEDMTLNEFISPQSQKRKKKEPKENRIIAYTLKQMWVFGKKIIGSLPELSKGNEISMLLKYLVLNLLQPDALWAKEVTKHTLCNEKYVVLKRLGGGAEGTVFKCMSNESNQFVAVKKFAEIFDRERLEEFEWEVNQVESMNHPNITPYLDSFIENKGDNEYSCAVVMPFIESTLHQRLLECKKKNLKYLPNWLDIALQISLGLQYLHYRNLIFRDLKAENILLETRDAMDVAKISDFGLMRAHQGMDCNISMRGTPITLAPEVTEGKYKIDKSSDIFSLGCVFYELLTLDIQVTRIAKNGQHTKFLMHEAIKTDESDTHVILSSQLKKNNVPELIIRLIISMVQYHPLKRPSIDSIVDILDTFSNHVGNSVAREQCAAKYNTVLLKLPETKDRRKKKLNFLKVSICMFFSNAMVWLSHWNARIEI